MVMKLFSEYAEPVAFDSQNDFGNGISTIFEYKQYMIIRERRLHRLLLKELESNGYDRKSERYQRIWKEYVKYSELL